MRWGCVIEAFFLLCSSIVFIQSGPVLEMRQGLLLLTLVIQLRFFDRGCLWMIDVLGDLAGLHVVGFVQGVVFHHLPFFF